MATVLYVDTDGNQTSQPVSQIDGSGNATPVPIDVSGDIGQAYLVRYGTGIRGAGQAVSVTIGGQDAPVVSAGAHDALVGVDQVKVLVAPALARCRRRA